MTINKKRIMYMFMCLALVMLSFGFGFTSPQAAKAEEIVAAPTMTPEYYNCAVYYEWEIFDGSADTTLYMSTTDVYYSDMYTKFHREAATPFDGKRRCKPQYCFAKTYNKSTGEFSKVVNVIDDKDTAIYLGYECKYSMVGQVANWIMPVDATIPTTWDQDGYIWNHNGNSRKYIKGSIIVNEKVEDIEVKIPWIGTKTSDIVTVGNLSFQLRWAKQGIHKGHNAQCGSYANALCFWCRLKKRNNIKQSLIFQALFYN